MANIWRFDHVLKFLRMFGSGYKRKFDRLVINVRFKAESGRKWRLRSMSVDNVDGAGHGLN
jgi:hypothetical protein